MEQEFIMRINTAIRTDLTSSVWQMTRLFVCVASSEIPSLDPRGREHMFLQFLFCKTLQTF